MEQLNNVLPNKKEGGQSITLNLVETQKSSPLLNKVRQNFGMFGGISLAFGVGFAICFYRAGIGINVLLFGIIMIRLLTLVMKNLELPLKRATIACYIGTLLLGLSSMLTANGTIQFLNVIGMMLLLDVSLLHQFNDDHQWDFSKYMIQMITLPFKSIATIFMPFIDCVEYSKNTKLFKNEKVRSVMIGIAISIPLLLMIVGLLSSADLLFGKMTQGLFNFLFSSRITSVILMILFGYLACYCILCGSASHAGMEVNKANKKADASIAITVLGLLCFVYVLFCGIQVLYLFADGLFVLPAEFTFSEYARRGFFELLAVTCINIVIMLVCTTWFKESKVIRFLLTCMTVCTYIMIGSAVYRMLLYIGAYHLTFLRLFVLLFLVIDSFVLAGVIISVYKKFPLFGYCVTVVSVCYLIFSFARPDYYIASYYLNQEDEINTVDILYLTEELSLDAAPVVVPLLHELREGYHDKNEISQNWIEDRIRAYLSGIKYTKDNSEIRDYNISVHQAVKLIGK